MAKEGEVGKREECLEMLPQSEKMKAEASKCDLEDAPCEVSSQSTTFFTRHKSKIGHVVKTVIVGLGFFLFDVFSDIGSGIYLYQTKNVTRQFPANDSTVPDHCFAMHKTTGMEQQQNYEWLEDKTFWAETTFGHIQLLAVLLAICVALAVVVKSKMKNGKSLLGAFLLPIIPFFLLAFTVSDNVVPLPNTTTEWQTYYCLENDTVWAAITFACMHLPAVVLAMCSLLAMVVNGWGNPVSWKILLGTLLLGFIPFPMLVLAQQVASLFFPEDSQMTLFSSILLFSEGALEASPQLLILLYIIVSDAERQIPWVQKASIVSSLLTISKTSIGLFLSESYSRGSKSQDILNHSLTLNDSLLKEKNLVGKLSIMAQLSPAFILSLGFKVGSIAVICALLKAYALVYLVIGIAITFIVAFFTYDRSATTDEKAGSALFYSLTNTIIVAKCPLGSRKDNYVQMKAVSISWLLLHTTTLLSLMIWVGLLPESTHLDHWSSHRLVLIRPSVFYHTVSGILLLGLLGLKRQVVDLGEKEKGERKFWDAQSGSVGGRCTRNPDKAETN